MDSKKTRVIILLDNVLKKVECTVGSVVDVIGRNLGDCLKGKRESSLKPPTPLTSQP